LLLSLADRYRLKNYAIIFLSIYLALVIAYRLSIQQDFVQAWQNQRSFWTNAVEVLPDMQDHTVIFVLDKDLPKTRYVYTNSWADPIILRQLFNFPERWVEPPRLFVVGGQWFRSIRREGNNLKWYVPDATWVAHWETFPYENVIFLEMENGKLIRRFGSFNINGSELKAKPLGAKQSFEKGPLYNYLIMEGR
jgi:hypothetical protein